MEEAVELIIIDICGARKDCHGAMDICRKARFLKMQTQTLVSVA